MDRRRSELRRERRVYGFLEGVARPSGSSNYARMDLVLDSVDATHFDGSELQIKDPENLSIVRILTTQKRISELFGVGTDITEGSWFNITLARKQGHPLAWVLDATGDYGGAPVRTNVIGLEKLADPSHPKVFSQEPALVTQLRTWCMVNLHSKVPNSVIVAVPPASDPCIRMIDVGHANCAAIHVTRSPDSRTLGYYDVGSPVFFHGRTFPKNFVEHGRVPKTGFVILSHWDFDHYSLAVTRLKSLQALQWYAPDQSVGPNAARLQAILGGRLHVIDATHVAILPSLNLWKGQGALSDRNNSGYVLKATRGQRSALLTGDVGYEAIPPAVKTGLTDLGVTHHGGNGSANPPSARGDGHAVVSYGFPNRYGHPNETNLAAHLSAGWAVTRTAGDGVQSRGDAWLL
jgi:beta-lactamase superfamily II metal-dependent hydrolase